MGVADDCRRSLLSRDYEPDTSRTFGLADVRKPHPANAFAILREKVSAVEAFKIIWLDEAISIFVMEVVMNRCVVCTFALYAS